MLLLWVTLLVLHRGYSLVPVVTVQPGEPATFKCVLTGELGSGKVYWYKQSTGDTLKLIVMQLTSKNPQYTPEFNESRIKVINDEKFSNLTIVRTTQEDEGMYHCAFTEWIGSNTEWSGTYLFVKGKSQKTSNYTVVQQPTVSGPVRPGDSVTLQCSVLSDSEDKMCPANHSVYWFRAGSHESHPDIIYTDGNGPDKCDKRSDSLKSCVYRFSKTISSSDAGTYYCAVATCGEILFGNGTKLNIEGTANDIVFLLCFVLAITLVVIISFICNIKENKCHCCKAAVALQNNSGGQRSQQRDEDTWVYSAVIFTMMKTDSGAVKDGKAADRERIYAAVKAFGLD